MWSDNKDPNDKKVPRIESPSGKKAFKLLYERIGYQTRGAAAATALAQKIC